MSPTSGPTSTRKPGGRGDTAAEATEVLEGKRRGPGQILPFLGPAFVAAVAYVDPGNFATAIQAGAQDGYLLVWVVVASNLAAALIQSLSAKLGIATGQNLAQIIRGQYPRLALWVIWPIAEAVAMATDLAEFIGAALGFYLLLGIPLIAAGLLTGVVTFSLLAIQRSGFRQIERLISAFVGVIALCYVVELILGRPDWDDVLGSFTPPSLAGPDAVLLTTGILGATIMPHVIFLHSALTQKRVVVSDPSLLRRLYRFELVDVGLAMGLAGLVNAAMLITAAATFHVAGQTQVTTLEQADMALEPLLGTAAHIVFAVALLASGLSSAVVGTMSGQVVMQGFVQWRMPAWLWQLLTMAPALVIIALGFDPTRTLVLSQVVLSFGVPFALVPLVLFTRRRDLMGPLVNRRITTLAAGLISGLIIALNLYLLYQALAG